MKNTFLAIGLCIFSGAAFGQNQPDSIHLVLHENKNGNMRTLDTIVPASEHNHLLQWMRVNGWDVPPPPPPPGQGQFENVIVVEGDSGMMPPPPPNGERRQVMFVRTDGDSSMPPPPGCRMKMQGQQGPDGNGMQKRPPLPPPPPGSQVEVSVIEKDTVINGETRKMIIHTEKTILPAGVNAPPRPPMPPQPPIPQDQPQNGKKPGAPAEHQKQLVVFPNPANSIINVAFDVNAKEKTLLTVTDMNGKVVYSEEIVENESKHVSREINLSGKSKGTYTVEVKTDKKVLADRVIVQ